MKKNLWYVPLIGVLTFLSLNSCRSEEGYLEQKKVGDLRFSSFVSKDGKEVNYGNGFAYLMKRYDGLYKTNLSGINNNPTISNLSSSTERNAVIVQNTGSYIEFMVRSQLITEENGDKWIVFPKVKGNQVIGLVVGVIVKKETGVAYRNIKEQTELYKNNILAFQQALIRYQNKAKKNSSLYLQANISPVAEIHPCDLEPNLTPQEREYCKLRFQEIEPVDLYKYRPFVPLGPGWTDGGGGDPDGCEKYKDCNETSTPPSPVTPPGDECNKAKKLLTEENVKKTIGALEEKLKKGSGQGEDLYIMKKNGGVDVIHGEKDHVNFSLDIYTKGLVHDHDKLGHPMFPPHDIDAFISTVRVQNYPPDPNDTTDKSENAFSGIVTPNGNYFMFFKGTKDDLPPRMDFKTVEDYQLKFGDDIYKMRIYKVPITDKVLEKLFFDYLDKMGLKGKVELLKQKNGVNYPVYKDSNGSIVNDKSC
ncbi:hypothetical protein VO54_00542 [Elizabethkingia miricola]|nr:hypothetical protein VO54_00542 [Elizabethkingia miricola]